MGLDATVQVPDAIREQRVPPTSDAGSAVSLVPGQDGGAVVPGAPGQNAAGLTEARNRILGAGPDAGLGTQGATEPTGIEAPDPVADAWAQALEEAKANGWVPPPPNPAADTTVTPQEGQNDDAVIEKNIEDAWAAALAEQTGNATPDTTGAAGRGLGAPNGVSAVDDARQAAGFEPTHVASDGTPVRVTDEPNVYVDAEGFEIEDRYAEPERTLDAYAGPALTIWNGLQQGRALDANPKIGGGGRYAAEIWDKEHPKLLEAHQRIEDLLDSIEDPRNREAARQYLKSKLPDFTLSPLEIAHFGEQRTKPIPSPKWMMDDATTQGTTDTAPDQAQTPAVEPPPTPRQQRRARQTANTQAITQEGTRVEIQGEPGKVWTSTGLVTGKGKVKRVFVRDEAGNERHVVVSGLRVVDPQPQPQETPNGLQEGQGREEAAKVAKPQPRSKPRIDELDPTQDDIVTAVAKLGGLRLSEVEGTALSDYKKPIVGVRRLVHNGKTAKSRADITERLRELGYPVQDENDLMDVLDRAVRGGSRVITPQGADAEGQRQLERYKAELEARSEFESAQHDDWTALDQAHEEMPLPEQEQRADEIRLAGIQALGEDAYDALAERIAAQHEQSDTDTYLNALEQAISDEQASRTQPAGQGATGDRQTEPGGFTLTGESQAELDAKRQADEQRAKAEADRLKAEETRRKADARRDDFNLSVVETNPERRRPPIAGRRGWIWREAAVMTTSPSKTRSAPPSFAIVRGF
jgi:hypothetical protein